MSPDPVLPAVVLPRPLAPALEAKISDLVKAVQPGQKGYADVSASLEGVGGGVGVKLNSHVTLGGWAGLARNTSTGGWGGLAAGVRAVFNW